MPAVHDLLTTVSGITGKVPYMNARPASGDNNSPSKSSPITSRTWIRVGLAMFAVGFGTNLFAPMLEVYRDQDGISEASVTAMFGIYAAGLVPALLIFGPVSDHYGRRAVVRPALILVAVASGILAAGSQAPEWVLYVGRWIMGFGVGMAMSSGSAWIKQLSVDRPTAGPRRATIVLSAGFGGGPLIAGQFAEFLPGPQITPYLLHIALVIVTIPLVWGVPETQFPAEGRVKRPPLVPRIALTGRFFWAVAAWAPWVFGTATVAFTSIPGFVTDNVEYPVAYLGLISGVGMFSGVFIQPVAAKLATYGWLPLSVVGLGAASVGLVLGAVAIEVDSALLVIPAAIILGCSYGIMMVSGLREVEIIAEPHELGALIGVFYTLTYTGFAVPFVLAVLGPFVGDLFGIGPVRGFIACLAFGVVVCLVSTVPVARAASRAVPHPRREV